MGWDGNGMGRAQLPWQSNGVLSTDFLDVSSSPDGFSRTISHLGESHFRVLPIRESGEVGQRDGREWEGGE